ncbi:MAG: hypothetical protein E6J71_13150 [Deltaproteobacteria bacterium]|nr:MAG: hypothetical protein E6J71_13150 [Deltaproteobacteria bacterium]
MAASRLRVVCIHCRRPLAQVHDVGLSTLTVMTTHLRRRHPEEQLGYDPTRDAILRHFTITPMDPDDDPPNAA